MTGSGKKGRGQKGAGISDALRNAGETWNRMAPDIWDGIDYEKQKEEIFKGVDKDLLERVRAAPFEKSCTKILL